MRMDLRASTLPLIHGKTMVTAHADAMMYGRRARCYRHVAMCNASSYSDEPPACTPVCKRWHTLTTLMPFEISHGRKAFFEIHGQSSRLGGGKVCQGDRKGGAGQGQGEPGRPQGWGRAGTGRTRATARVRPYNITNRYAKRVYCTGAPLRSPWLLVLGDEDFGPIVGWKLALGVVYHADNIRLEQVYLSDLLHRQPGYVVD
jgi:hypothetical protein